MIWLSCFGVWIKFEGKSQHFVSIFSRLMCIQVWKSAKMVTLWLDCKHQSLVILLFPFQSIPAKAIPIYFLVYHPRPQRDFWKLTKNTHRICTEWERNETPKKTFVQCKRQHKLTVLNANGMGTCL